MLFDGDKLFWTQGVFEFRYHHDGKHNVMAISLPFEIRIGRFDEEDVEVDSNGLIRTAVEMALLPVVRNCFDRDPDIAPNSVDESFGSLVERDGKYAKRVIFCSPSDVRDRVYPRSCACRWQREELSMEDLQC